ncbi:MAG: pyruvyl transferase, partial [Pseudonocardiales bacterium]|nr:pyruvyl transferase [Pseudonocardiales bacterium]
RTGNGDAGAVSAEIPYAFWCRAPSTGNVGDRLTPWLIHRLTGHWPRFARPGSPVRKFLVAGSILEYTDVDCTVWGAGIMRRDDPINPGAQLLAVRGPLSRRRALQCGAECPEVYGDPAMLLPDLLPARPTRPHGIGIVPHLADRSRLRGYLPGGSRLIDVRSDVETFVREVVECELVCSSSLHGLIIAQAYGIPVVWLRFCPLPSGDGVKFTDYFLATGQPDAQPVDFGDGQPNPAGWQHAILPAPPRDVGALWASSPFTNSQPHQVMSHG